MLSHVIFITILWSIFYLIISIKVNIQYYISFRCTKQWLDVYIHYEVIILVSSTHLTPYIYITMFPTMFPTLFPTLYLTSLWLFFFNYNLNFLTTLPFSSIPSKPSPIWRPSIYSLYLWVCICLFVHLYCSLDYTYE